MHSDAEYAHDADGEVAAKVISLSKKRTLSLKKQLDDISQHLSPDSLRHMDEVDITMYLELVERLRTSYDDAQSCLEAEDHSELASEVSWSFARLHMEVKGKLTRELNQRRADLAHSSTVRPFVSDDASPSFIISQRNRLPELQVPHFDGAYTDWPDFIAMFNSVIHSCTELSKIEKFQHLRANLKGAALDTIRSLEPTEVNYDKALELLKKRFGNQLLNFQAHIKEIFALKIVGSGCASEMRSFSDKLNSHLRSLQTMATGDQIADGLLIYLISRKLDTKTQIKWEEDLPTNSLPTWASMAAFLEKRCRMLENVEATVPAASNNSVLSKRSPHGNNSFRRALVTSASVCSFCGSTSHWIYSCSQFGALSPASRYKEAKRLQLCLNCLRQGHTLNKCKSGHCRQCTSKHHSLLHMHKGEQPTPHRFVSNSEVGTPLTSSSRVQKVATAACSENFVLLATAIVLIKNGTGCYVPCRALLDSASQVNFVTTRLVNQLNIKTKRTTTSISGIGESNFVADRAVDILARARNDDYTFGFEAIVTNTITDYQPNFNLTIDSWNIPPNTKLADPCFNKSQRIDVLLGASIFFDILCVGQIKLATNLPILQKTRLGWVASGGGLHFHKSSALVAVLSQSDEEEASLNDLVNQFWEVESCSVQQSQTQEELNCELHFQQNYIRLDSGEYAVRLPLKIPATNLADSYTQAKQRFLTLERKLQHKPDIKAQYSSFMNEYAELKHMSLAGLDPQMKTFFLPHHCVHKADSTTTKLRVVFDGSAKSTSGYSLNDVLMVGPTIQPTLFNTLLRFRMFKVALTGDVCKMYRCVRILHPDNYLQCILWRDDPKAELKAYTLDTVTYGTRPAAFLAIRAMHQLATDEEANFPLGAQIIRRDFYVDDLITGADTVEQVIEIRRQTTHLLQRGNFSLRKWCSNDSASLNGIAEVDREPLLQFRDGTHITKALGLVWDPKADDFIFSLAPMKSHRQVTKRIALSTIARFYDPLGLIAPVLTQAKIFIQNMWKQQLHWDESLPQNLHKCWTDFCGELELVSNFHFPRYVLMPNSHLELHAFCDASLAAYGACIYVRAQYIDEVRTSLLCSKSRVAPLKTLTIPKLELCAAFLLAELIESIRQTNIFDCNIHCWSDSTVVLSWLREESSNFNTFVSNRVSHIQTLTKGMIWHHVPTALNPADILSRGASASELLNSQLWMHGPSFLLGNQNDWPSAPDFLNDLPERRRSTLATIAHFEDISLRCKYINAFSTMQRVFAYVSRFIGFIARKALTTSRTYGALTPEDIKFGTHLLLRMIQQIHFAFEYKALKAKRSIESSSAIYSLNPFLDDFGLIRVGGRLENSILDYEARHPIILPKRHPITIAIIQHFHQKMMHAGPQSLTASIRLQFWPIGGRKTVASVVNKCLRCFRMKPKIVKHIMGDLPQHRVQPCRPFFTTGIDFCGPFYYKSAVRNKGPIKCYICVFICFSTKAMHLELVCDLSTPSFLAALKRFISTRGRPKTIWSDNATNFVGARNELTELKNLFLSKTHLQTVHGYCLDEGIEWRFIPPRSPHFGGLWEAAVKAAKFHFYRVVGLSVLTFEELRTLVCQVCAIINSRPLYAISENPDDLEVLTPAHFLIGGPFTSFPEPNVTDIETSRLDRWQRLSFMQQMFWKKWSTNYLTILQERSKWKAKVPNIQKGAMVLLKDENLPPLKWQLGRVVEVIFGSDKVARVALIQTENGVIKRAVNKIAILPMESFEGQSPSTGEDVEG